MRLATNERLTFDRLILATGATPRRLDVPVDPAARLYYLRTWAHADALRGIADAVRKVVIIGSGFIGLEAAASLRDRGLDVTVVGRDDRLFHGHVLEQLRRGAEEPTAIRVRHMR